jgi:hypothetical protein
MGACPCPADEFQVDEDDSWIDNDLQADKDTKLKFVFCLTNGQEVFKSKDLKAALLADQGLGIKCMNECVNCDLKCPRIPKPWGEMRRTITQAGFGGPRGRGGMEERRRHEEMDSEDEENPTPAKEFEKAQNFGYGKRWMREEWESKNTTAWKCEDDQ